MMPITCEWYNEEKSVICWTFTGVWSWEEALATQTQCNEMIDSVTGTVHFLLDVTQSTVMPLGAIQKIPELFLNGHPRRGVALTVIKPQSALYHLWKTFTAVLPEAKNPNILFFPTMEKAQHYLASMRNATES